MMWEADDLRFRGFKLSNKNVIFLPPKTTSWVQPLDQRIIRSFKAIIASISLVNHGSEQWTKEPQSDEEDATAAYDAREASNEKEANDSEPVVLMTLREARGAGQALKTFVQENERMRPHLQAIESMVREMEAMTVSAGCHQICIIIFCLCVLMLMIYQQVLRRIKVLLSRCVCTELDIVD